MGGRKILMPIALILSALSTVAGMLPYMFIWLIVKELLSSGGSIALQSPISIYAWWAVGMAMLSVLLYFVGLMLSHLAAFRVEKNMRAVAMGKLVNLPLGYFDKNTSGRIRKIIDDDSSTTHTFIAHQLPDLAGSMLAPIIVVVLIFVFDWRLGLAALIPIAAALAAMMTMMGKDTRGFQKTYMDALEDMSTEAVEYVRGIPVVKVFQQTIFSFKRFHGSIIRYKDLVSQYALSSEKAMSAYIVCINAFAYVLAPATILIIGRTSNYTSVLTDMFFYILITPIFVANIMKIMYVQNGMFIAKEAVNRLEKLTDFAPLVVSKDTQPIKNHLIEFKDVVFSYEGANKNAVDGISFTIPEGKMYALVGQSGGGKTTIARLIPRFWDVKEGSVSIGGVDVRNIANEELMKSVSFVFQNTKLFKTTLLENITLGNPTASQAEIDRAIDLSQSREIIDQLPNGLQTKIGVDGTYLSGGEQQRIALARAILKDAPIVVLDEATAFADPENEHLIQVALRALMKGKTVLMIAHRLTTIQDADQILVIENGKIAERGTHIELIARNAIYSGMWKEYQRAVEWEVKMN